MATAAQRTAARKNIKKAQQAWRAMSPRAHALAQPDGRSRRKPGTTGEGGFFHVEVRPKSEFEIFRTQDVGRKGGIERVAGKRGSGSWSTQKWLIGKAHAHVVGRKLVADTADARKVLDALGSAPVRIGGDRFMAKDRRNVPEREKPTLAQRRAQQRNIKRAQAAKRRMRADTR